MKLDSEMFSQGLVHGGAGLPGNCLFSTFSLNL